MKIERLNDYQIKCTLTGEDLQERNIKLSELAYGTDKARELFGDMIMEAGEQLGFEVEDMPLMIEAVPIGSECIVLIITKVEDPEEMDTRFANYAPSVQYGEAGSDAADPGDDVTDIFRRLQQGDFPVLPTAGKVASGRSRDVLQPAKKNREVPAQGQDRDSLVWSFAGMHDVIAFAGAAGISGVSSSLYKDPSTGRLILLMITKGVRDTDLKRLTAGLAEFGRQEKGLARNHAYLEEHLETVIADNALENLAGL